MPYSIFFTLSSHLPHQGDCGGDSTEGEGAGGAAFFFDASNWARKLSAERKAYIC